MKFFCSINFSFAGTSRKNKNHPKIHFLSCLVGKEIIQENSCPTPPPHHIATLLFFFSGSDQEEHLGEQPKIFEELIGEEEEENIPPKTMVENRNARRNGERV